MPVEYDNLLQGYIVCDSGTEPGGQSSLFVPVGVCICISDKVIGSIVKFGYL